MLNVFMVLIVSSRKHTQKQNERLNVKQSNSLPQRFHDICNNNDDVNLC